MNTLALANKQNFPLTTDALRFMQEAYAALEQLTKLGGDNYILSGCVVTGSSASSGWMVIGGKLVPFAGGSIQTNVQIITTTSTVVVGTGTRDETVYSAEFGTSANPAENVLWATLNANRITSTIDWATRLAVAEAKVAPAYSALTPSAGVSLTVGSGVGFAYLVTEGKKNTLHFKLSIDANTLELATFEKDINFNGNVGLSGGGTYRFSYMGWDSLNGEPFAFSVNASTNKLSAVASSSLAKYVEGTAIWYEA